MEIGGRGKKVLYIIGITAGVYLSFRYLLPLIIPFLIAYLGASVLAPCVHFLEKRLHLRRSWATILTGLLFLGILGTVGIWLMNRLLEQAGAFLSGFSTWEPMLSDTLYNICCQAEKNFGMEPETIYYAAKSGIQKLSDNVEEQAMPLVMSSSLPIVKWVFETVAVIFITLISMLFICKDYEVLKERQSRMMFAEEMGVIGKKMSQALGAYVKTQGIIMVFTALVCTAGLFILKNPYALLLGVVIGAMDALPLIGTGLIFIPWIIIVFLMGNWKMGAGLVIIYAICYLLRELLEPRLMGRQIGMTSLEMIISIYIGLKLFGIGGVVLGPVGYLLIVEIMGQIFDR